MKIFDLIFCHLVGDYVLQSNFLAETKGENPYHLIVHAMLYSLPFYIIFGAVWQLPIVFFSHITVDAFKAHFNKIGYIQDQFFHYVMCLIYFV